MVKWPSISYLMHIAAANIQMICSNLVIKPRNFDYIRLLNKSCENEVTLREQNPPLKYRQPFEFWAHFKMVKVENFNFSTLKGKTIPLLSTQHWQCAQKRNCFSFSIWKVRFLRLYQIFRGCHFGICSIKRCKVACSKNLRMI